MKSSITSFLSAATVAALTATTAMGQDKVVLNLGGESQQESIPLKVVDRHIIFMMDVSQSVDTEEYKIAMNGLAQGLLSGEASMHFNNGSVYAVTLIMFAGTNKASETFIIQSDEDAQNFVGQYIWDFENDRPFYPDFNTEGTGIYNAYMTVRNVLDAEENNGLSSLERSLVVVGDGPENRKIYANIAKQTASLAQDYNVVTYGVPIVVHNMDATAHPGVKTSEDLVRYFSKEIVTQTSSSAGFEAGTLHIANGFADVRRAVNDALKIVLG